MKLRDLKSLWTHREAFAVIALAVIVSTVVVARLCLRRPQLTIAIHQGVEGVALKRVVRRFSDTHDISVEVVELPYALLRKAEDHELCEQVSRFDVIMMDDPWLPGLIEGGKECPRSGRERLYELAFTKDERADLEDFVEPSLRVCRYPTPITRDSKYYALPFVGNSQLFCYRAGAFSHDPENWDAVLKASQDKPKMQRPGLVLRVGPGNSIVTDFMPILWSYDSSSFTPESADFGNPTLAMKGFETLTKLAGKQNIGSASVDDFDLAAYMAAKDGADASIVWSAWAMMMLRADPSLSKDLKFAAMPGGPSELGVWLLAVPRNVAPGHWERANELVLYATSKDQITAAAYEGNPPPRRKVLQDLKSRFPTFSAQLASLSLARPRPRVAQWADIEDALGECLIQEIAGNNSSRQCMLKACTAAHDQDYCCEETFFQKEEACIDRLKNK